MLLKNYFHPIVFSSTTIYHVTTCSQGQEKAKKSVYSVICVPIYIIHKELYGKSVLSHYHFTRLNPKKRALSNFAFQHCKEFIGTQCKKNFSDPPRDY